MSSRKKTTKAKGRRRRDGFPPDAKVRKVLVTLELLTSTPLNEIRAYYRLNWAAGIVGRMHQVQVQAVRLER